MLLAELQQQQVAGSSGEAELAGMQAIVDYLARKKVRLTNSSLGSVCSIESNMAQMWIHFAQCRPLAAARHAKLLQSWLTCAAG
jgi:hypothetical protein